MIDPSANSLSSGQSGRIQLQSQRQSSLFRAGIEVRVYVERAAAGGTVVLRAGNTLVRATTLFPLRQGEWYVVRPEFSRGRLSLRVERHVPRPVVASDIAREVGIPQDKTALNLVRAFVRTGLPLEPERIQRVYRRLSGMQRHRGEDTREKTRLAAILERKGLWVDGAMVEAVLGSGGESQDGKRRREEKDDSRREEKPSIRKLVRDAFALSEEAESPLQLFNHMIGEGDHWVVIPIRSGDDGVEASLRIRVPRGFALGQNDGQAAYREALLVTERDGETYVFALHPSTVGVRVTLLEGDGKAVGAAMDADLAEHLAAIGATFHHAPISNDSSDGFSSEEVAGIIASVDSTA